MCVSGRYERLLNDVQWCKIYLDQPVATDSRDLISVFGLVFLLLKKIPPFSPQVVYIFSLDKPIYHISLYYVPGMALNRVALEWMHHFI